MAQILTHKILPTILPLYTMFESVCSSSLTSMCNLTLHAVLTPYLPRIKVRKEKNLLNKDTDEEAEQEVEEVCQTEISIFNSPLNVNLAWYHCSTLAYGNRFFT